MKLKLTTNFKILIVFHTVYHYYAKVINCERNIALFYKKNWNGKF